MTALKCGSKWKGFYDAPLPYGRQEFTCHVEEVKQDYTFVGNGEDKDGKFSVKGSLTNIKAVSNEEEDGNQEVSCGDVFFVKDYLSESGYKGIDYKGTLRGSKITGNYSFVWKKSFISKTVTGIFEMNLMLS